LVLIGFIVGFLGDAIIPGEIPFSWFGGIIFAMLGGYVGGALVGRELGPAAFGLALIPALVGAIVLAVAFELVLRLIAWAVRR
ncbi:MAG: hypothetical protein HYY04_11625, partial [Chloroflexi bacterium]|nr:hypothetical protein [Chloroflexota bacterium]